MIKLSRHCVLVHMKLVFLGTASCFPTARRGVSCIALRLEKDGSIWLFDCGEGSQIQLQKSSIRPGKITKIFITHLHGDHLFGLPGLICTLSSQCSFKPDFILEIFGPQGLRQYVRQSLNLSRSPLPFQYMVHELVPVAHQYPKDWGNWTVDHDAHGPLHPQEILGRQIEAESDVWTLIPGCQESHAVLAGPLQHRIPCFGFVVQEPSVNGKLDVEKFAALGGKPGPECALLKKGTTITLLSGAVIKPSDVIGPPQPGRKIVILGDTCNSDKMKQIASKCDVLVHEATLENAMEENALEKGHSTPDMAATFAQLVEARMLILNHFSQRYQHDITLEMGPGPELLAVEAREKLGEDSSCKVVVADDLLEICIPRPHPAH
ncbi:hypothetical protein B566_EDAN005912 [Ephemera danica]|nr:hypothetical protein B566_EDAN005912 [Ephemera danica]